MAQGSGFGRVHLAFRLADVHVDQLRSLDRQEVERALRGDRLRQQRLARAWASGPEISTFSSSALPGK